MSIQSTITISRQEAINRIYKMHNLLKAQNYREVEANSFEDNDQDIKSFVDDYYNRELGSIHLEMWTNKMLEVVMDFPFIRESMFENYEVID